MSYEAFKKVLRKKKVGHHHFLIFHDVFRLFGRYPIFNNLDSLNLSNIDIFKMDMYNNNIPVTLSQTTNFGLFQTERVWRRQFKIS